MFVWSIRIGREKAKTRIGKLFSKKNEDAPNEYSGELYWIGEPHETDNTYLESLIVKKDDEFLLSSDTEIPMHDYAGGTYRDGSAKEISC